MKTIQVNVCKCWFSHVPHFFAVLTVSLVLWSCLNFLKVCSTYDILTATAWGFQNSYFYQKIILSPIEKLSLVRFEIIKKSSPRSAKIIIFLSLRFPELSFFYPCPVQKSSFFYPCPVQKLSFFYQLAPTYGQASFLCFF